MVRVGEAWCEGRVKMMRTGEVDDVLRRQQPSIMDYICFV